MALAPGRVSPSIKLSTDSVLEMKDQIYAFVEEKGVPGIMPTVAQLVEVLPEAVNAINRAGGVMRAAKALNLLMTFPKSREGVMNVPVPTKGWGDEKTSIAVELTEEIKAKIEVIKSDAEYKKRQACNSLDKDLFVSDALAAIRAEAGAQQQATISAATSAADAEPVEMAPNTAVAKVKESDDSTMRSSPRKPVVTEAKQAASDALAPAIAKRRTVRELKKPILLLAGGVSWAQQGKKAPKEVLVSHCDPRV